MTFGLFSCKSFFGLQQSLHVYNLQCYWHIIHHYYGNVQSLLRPPPHPLLTTAIYYCRPPFFTKWFSNVFITSNKQSSLEFFLFSLPLSLWFEFQFLLRSGDFSGQVRIRCLLKWRVSVSLN